MGSGLRQEEALAVAIQSDGKIVVVGQAAIDATPPAPDLPATFAIARYNSDGSLDTGFGTGGRVSGSVNGIARAVAIQPDGKIVLAGDFELELSNGVFASDIVVARFNANGSLDLPFGTSGTGQVATDIGGAANSGRNLVLQPNGAIVVSGTPQCGQPGCVHTDVVRYNANGTLDPSFGNGGKLTLADVDVGQGLVRQADGKLVLVGTIVQAIAPATARFVLMRRNGDGSPDTGFGSAGTASTALSENAVCRRHRTAGRWQARGGRHARLLAERELHRRALQQRRLAGHRLRQRGRLVDRLLRLHRHRRERARATRRPDRRRRAGAQRRRRLRVARINP